MNWTDNGSFLIIHVRCDFPLICWENRRCEQWISQFFFHYRFLVLRLHLLNKLRCVTNKIRILIDLNMKMAEMNSLFNHSRDLRKCSIKLDFVLSLKLMCLRWKSLKTFFRPSQYGSTRTNKSVEIFTWFHYYHFITLIQQWIQ